MPVQKKSGNLLNAPRMSLNEMFGNNLLYKLFVHIVQSMKSVLFINLYCAVLFIHFFLEQL